MKSINLTVFSLFLSLIAFSQTLVLNKNGDTTVCFSVERAKYLAKEHYRAETYYKLDSICELKARNKDLEINMYKKIQEDLESVINNTNKISSLKDENIEALKKSIEIKDGEIRKQKLYKWVSIAAGGALSGFMGYLYITK